jgi:hypothetical protein
LADINTAYIIRLKGATSVEFTRACTPKFKLKDAVAMQLHMFSDFLSNYMRVYVAGSILIQAWSSTQLLSRNDGIHGSWYADHASHRRRSSFSWLEIVKAVEFRVGCSHCKGEKKAFSVAALMWRGYILNRMESTL